MALFLMVKSLTPIICSCDTRMLFSLYHRHFVSVVAALRAWAVPPALDRGARQ